VTGRNNRISITGGTFTGSAIGNEQVQVTNTGGVEQVTVEDLRSSLAEAREEIIGLAEDPDQRSRLRVQVAQVEEELRADEPDGDVVRGGWKRVMRVLDGGAQASESVAKIWQAISSLFPA
jgi:hypothetical protein